MNYRHSFVCENGHSTVVYSSDPYYPEWVECMECGKKMEHDGPAE